MMPTSVRVGDPAGQKLLLQLESEMEPTVRIGLSRGFSCASAAGDQMNCPCGRACCRNPGDWPGHSEHPMRRSRRRSLGAITLSSVSGVLSSLA
jgi:hypothetical protein